MFSTMPVDVYQQVAAGTDDMNNTLYEWAEPVTVEGCLVQPGSTSDLNAERPEGDRITLTVHIPKTAQALSYRGAKLYIGEPYTGYYMVVGDPVPYMEGNTPTDWVMPVEARRIDG